MQINQWIDKWAGEEQNRPFLLFEDQEISYEQLYQRVNSVAKGLSNVGVKKGDRVAIMLRNCPEFLYTWFALNRIGAIMVPINTAFLKVETAYILKDAGCIGVVAEDDLMERVVLEAVKESPKIKWVAGKKQKVRDLSVEEMLETEGEVPCREWPYEELAAILYTSGTTGNPKGVMCPHRYYSEIGSICKDWLNLTREDRLLTLLPLFHMNAQTTSTMGSLTAGATLVLLNGFNPMTFWQDICRYQATIFNYLGAMLPVMMKMPVVPEEKAHRVKFAVGAQADPNLIEEYEKRWNITMIELFGMTEIGGTCNPLNARRIGSCGVAFPRHKIKIVDDEGKELPPGQVGEIMVTGSSITLGYWQNEEETAKTYVDGWVKTGDMGYMDEDGYLYFVARKKDIIRRSGENISAVEVENVVMSHPKVMEAAAIAVPDPVRDEEVKVYVVLKPGETRDTVPPEEIIAWCQERLAKFKIPRYIEYRDFLPKTATQKIQKAVLKSEKEDLTEGAWDRFSATKEKAN